MGLFDKIKGPIFIKEGSGMQEEIDYLKGLLEKCPADKKAKIEQEIRNREYGIKGENAIAFELKNSGMPMIVLQDLYLEHDGLSAQIDFLVLTKDKSYIVECKNMYGDITITDRGEFFRKINGKSIKVYSPITQCERHRQLIFNIRMAKKNALEKMFFEKNKNNSYRPLVVMANPSGKINVKYAPQDMKKMILSADLLVRHIKENHNTKDEILEKHMVDLGDFFLGIHKENPRRYLDKYKDILDDIVDEVEEVETEVETKTEDLTNDTVVIEKEDIIEKVENIEKDETDTTKMICKRCGATMVLRTATKGENKGNQFYGCSSYPKCRNIINL